MKFPRVLLLVLVAVLPVAVSCHKDDDKTSDYFRGKIVLPMDPYVEAGFTKTFCVDTLSRLSRNEDGGIGYYIVMPNTTTRDTVKTENGSFTKKEFTVVAPDSLGTFKVSYSGFAKGYYDSTGSASFSVLKAGINNGGTLSNYDIKDDELIFEDERDGNKYYVTAVDTLLWMRQNLAWEGSGAAYMNCKASSVSVIFGRYYSWKQAASACPEGWRLPTDKEWAAYAGKYVSGAQEGKDIADVAGHFIENVYFNGERMWEYWRDVTIDNKARFSAIPTGYAAFSDEGLIFDGKDSYAVFWTADEKDGKGAYRYIYAEKPILHYGLADKSWFYASVRCVKDIEEL